MLCIVYSMYIVLYNIDNNMHHQEPGKNNNKYINNNTKTLCVKCLLGCEMDLCILDAYIYQMLAPFPYQIKPCEWANTNPIQPITPSEHQKTPTIQTHPSLMLYASHSSNHSSIHPSPNHLFPPTTSQWEKEHNKIEPKFIGLYKNHVPYRLHLREN